MTRPVYPYGFAVIPMDSDLKFRCYTGWVKNYGHCPIFPISPHDIPVHGDAPPCQVWLHKVQILPMTCQFMVMHRHAKFGYERYRFSPTAVHSQYSAMLFSSPAAASWPLPALTWFQTFQCVTWHCAYLGLHSAYLRWSAGCSVSASFNSVLRAANIFLGINIVYSVTLNLWTTSDCDCVTS